MHISNHSNLLLDISIGDFILHTGLSLVAIAITSACDELVASSNKEGFRNDTPPRDHVITNKSILLLVPLLSWRAK